MARAMWSGSVGFGLVSIPVGLYSATQEELAEAEPSAGNKGVAEKLTTRKADSKEKTEKTRPRKSAPPKKSASTTAPRKAAPKTPAKAKKSATRKTPAGKAS